MNIDEIKKKALQKKEEACRAADDLLCAIKSLTEVIRDNESKRRSEEDHQAARRTAT